MKSTIEKIEDLLNKEYESLDEMLTEIRRFTGTSAPNRYQLSKYLEEPKNEKEHAIILAASAIVVEEYERAISFLREASEGADKRWLLGLAYKGIGDYEHAIADFERAKNKGWDETQALSEMTECAKLAGNEKAANDYLKELKKLAGQSKYYYYQQARMLENEGEYEQAMELLEQAIEEDDKFTPAIFRLAYMQDLHGREEDAIELYKKCLECQPVHINAMLNLAVLLEDTGKFEQAKKLLEQILDVYPNHLRARLFLKDVEGSMVMRYDEESEKQRDKFQQVLEMPISDFELSVRSRNCLKKMGIRTLGDLTKITEAELLAYKNFGETSLNEIKAILASKNLRLGQALEDKASKKAAAMLPVSAPAGNQETKASDDISQMPIESLKLSVRSSNCLQNLNIRTIGDLLKYSESELMAVKNFGSVSLNEIKEKLAELGISLRA